MQSGYGRKPTMASIGGRPGGFNFGTGMQSMHRGTGYSQGFRGTGAYGGGFQIPDDILIHMQSMISSRGSPITFFVEFDGHQNRQFE